MNEDQKKIFDLIGALIDGYEAQRNLHSHECPTCIAGALALADGSLKKENFMENICSTALGYIRKVMQADIVVESFKRSRARHDKSYKYKAKPTDEIGLGHLYDQ